MRNILIVGGTGNLSFTVAKILLSEGFSVTCVTRGNNNALENSLIQLGAAIHYCSSTYFKLNLPYSLKPDYIIDFVAYTPNDIEEHVQAFYESGFERFIFISTTAFYSRGLLGDRFFSECDYDPSHPWLYAKAKFEAECYLQSIVEKLSIKGLSLRLGHTIGDFIPVFLGNPGLAFINHVQDTGIIPVSGNIMQPWSIGTAEGLGKVLAKIIYAENKIPQYAAVHFSEYTTSWYDIIKIFSAVVNPSARIHNIALADIERISPKWLPSIKYHKQFTDKYDLSLLSSIIDHQPSINLHNLISHSVSFTKSQKISTKYEEERLMLANLIEQCRV